MSIKALLKTIVVLAASGAFVLYLFGQNAVKKTDALKLAPSGYLIDLAGRIGVAVPEKEPLPQHFCEMDSDPFGISKMAHSITFMSLVEDVKSAESAAMKFLAAGDRDRMTIAAKDAISRWEHLLSTRARIDCYDLQAFKRSY